MLLRTKEAKRVYVLEQVIKGIGTISEAANLLGICQAWEGHVSLSRIWCRGNRLRYIRDSDGL